MMKDNIRIFFYVLEHKGKLFRRHAAIAVSSPSACRRSSSSDTVVSGGNCVGFGGREHPPVSTLFGKPGGHADTVEHTYVGNLPRLSGTLPCPHGGEGGGGFRPCYERRGYGKQSSPSRKQKC